jgi:Heat induced stress protein YflT
MNPMNKNTESTREGTVVVLFRDQPQAELAIRELKQEGFTDGQIGVLMQDRAKQEQLADSTGSTVSEAAKTGAIGGGLAGGVLGLLAGVGALAIPGVGPIIAGGALASTLAGAGIGAAAGGLIGALVGLGVPEEDAKYFEQGVRAGGILVTVDAGPRTREARQILTELGAELDSTARSASTSTFGNGDRQRVELQEEELEVSPWRGNERRYRHDKSYAGPERRLTNV